MSTVTIDADKCWKSVESFWNKALGETKKALERLRAVQIKITY